MSSKNDDASQWQSPVENTACSVVAKVTISTQ